MPEQPHPLGPAKPSLMLAAEGRGRKIKPLNLEAFKLRKGDTLVVKVPTYYFRSMTSDIVRDWSAGLSEGVRILVCPTDFPLTAHGPIPRQRKKPKVA